MHAAANGQENGATRPGASKPGGTGIRKRRRQMRAILKEGLEAALTADPEVLENCKPKTAAGRLVIGLLLEAAKCKATPLKILMSLVDWDADKACDEGRDADDGTPWDWSEDGEWLTMPEAEPAPGPAPATEEKDDGKARAELVRRLTRLEEAGQHEQVAKIVAAIRSGQYGGPEPLSTA